MGAMDQNSETVDRVHRQNRLYREVNLPGLLPGASKRVPDPHKTRWLPENPQIGRRSSED